MKICMNDDSFLVIIIIKKCSEMEFYLIFSCDVHFYCNYDDARDLFKYIFIQLIPYFCPKIKAIFDLLLHVQALLTTFVPKYYYSYLLHSSNMYFRHKSISCLVIFRLERKLLSSVCMFAVSFELLFPCNNGN